MKHGESDVERQISIQGIHLSAFWNYFWKREALKLVKYKPSELKLFGLSSMYLCEK